MIWRHKVYRVYHPIVVLNWLTFFIDNVQLLEGMTEKFMTADFLLNETIFSQEEENEHLRFSRNM